MHILAEYKGNLLIERYGKNYIRFFGGRDGNIPCEFPVSKNDADRIIDMPSMIEYTIMSAKNFILWTIESFYKIGIKEYLLYNMKLSEKRAEESYNKIKDYDIILNEFYYYIMNDCTFNPKAWSVQGFTAQRLVDNYFLSPLGAYNYLIYLLEKPDEALEHLRKGLPRK